VIDSPTAMPELVTERLLIRVFREDDLEAAHKILDVEEAVADGSPPPDLEHRRRLIEWTRGQVNIQAALLQPPYADRAIVLRETDQLVGSVGLVPGMCMSGRFPSLRALGVLPGDDAVYAEVALFWHVGRNHRGRGYATEAGREMIRYAFESLHVQRVIATTEDDNLASQRVMQRLGMTIERNPLPHPTWLQIVATLANPSFR
jgi:ribosomal-protein-alanine N-acetyltransferase